MSRILTVAFLAAAALVGCQKSEPGGGAGNETFKVVVPAMVGDVKQGEIQTVRISVERGAGFKLGVKLDVKAPTGLQVDPDSTTVKAAVIFNWQLKITAAKDAPLGEQKIMVKGTPDKGESAEVEFKVTVSAK
jgi:uncharacterized membrane protein